MADRVDLVVSVECGAKQAAASIEEAARGRSLAVRTELYAADGAVDELAREEIASAHAALIIGGAPFGAERFAGVPLISTGAACPLTVEAAGDLIDGALALARLSGNQSAPSGSPSRKETLGSMLRRKLARTPQEAAPRAQAPSGFAESVVSADYVLTGLRCSTRDEVLSTLSRRAVDLGLAQDADGLMAAFLKREAEGTTGMLDGFAIPHAKSATVQRAAVMVAKLAQGAEEWETMDGMPVRIAIALLIPEGQSGTTHLKLLSRVAEALMDDGFRAAVKDADDPEAVARVVSERLS